MQAFKMSPLCFESEGMAVLILSYSILANTRNGCERTKNGWVFLINYSDWFGRQIQIPVQRSIERYLYKTAVLLIRAVHFCLRTHSVMLFNLHVLTKKLAMK